MSNQIKIKPIDLQTIALKLLNNERIVSELANGERVITAEELSSKIPMLKSLGKMPLIQLRATETGNNYLIPSIYQKDEQNVIILPDINASMTEEFVIGEWKAGDVNRAVIRSKKHDVAVNAAIMFTSYALEDIQVNYGNRLQGEGSETLDARWLRGAPEIELPLRSLPIGVNLTVMGSSQRRSKQYNTLLVDIIDSHEKLYKNVITNAELRHLIADGIEQFKIKAVEDVPLKDSQAKSRKDKIRTITRVFLEPIDGADFSDF